MRIATFVKLYGRLIALCVVVLLATSCVAHRGSRPQPRDGSDVVCREGCDPASQPVIPAEADARRAIAIAKGEVLRDYPEARLASPRIAWRACFFMAYGYATPGGAASWVCAAGKTSADGRVSDVATWDRSPALVPLGDGTFWVTTRELALVYHEARNAFWIQAGHKERTF